MDAARAQAEILGSVSDVINAALLSPSNKSAFRLVLTVVEETENGAVPVARLETS